MLSPEEKRQGVIIADIGGGCTDISVFVEGSIHHTATLPIGGNHITRDLVVGLRCPYHSAEEAKHVYGHALPSAVPADRDGRARSVRRRAPAQLTPAARSARSSRPAVEEILELIVTEVSQATELELVSAGIVFTGGSARLPGLDLLAEQVTLLPARIGHPVHIFGLVDELHDPAFAAGVGLLQWAVGAGDLVPAVRMPSGPSAFDGMFKKLGNWFRVLLPE